MKTYLKFVYAKIINYVLIKIVILITELQQNEMCDHNKTSKIKFLITSKIILNTSKTIGFYNQIILVGTYIA